MLGSSIGSEALRNRLVDPHQAPLDRMTNMRPIIVLVALLLLGGTAACNPAAEITVARASVPRAAAEPARAADAGSAINAFGLDLYQRIRDGSANLVFSPASIAIALGMARAGARGATAVEMDAVLHDVATDAHAAWLNALDAALASRTGSFPDESQKLHPVTLRIANSLFSQRGLNLQDAYLVAMAERFGAGLRLVDYRADAEAARRAINAWVSEQTEQRIPELLVQGTITPDVLLTLVNAIYLKAAWLTPFLETATKDGSFTRLDGSTVTASFMHTISGLRYAEGVGWRAVELPYVGGSLAMTVVVPDDLRTFEPALSPAVLDAITAALAKHLVTLAYPKHSVESKLDLGRVLAAMGMPSAFGPADFSGITTDARLFISDVIHQANMDVDEKGTTAAAATAVIMRGSAPGGPVTLVVDRPFLFALRDVPTGTILFLGRVTDPASA
jgi:serpin B